MDQSDARPIDMGDAAACEGGEVDATREAGGAAGAGRQVSTSRAPGAARHFGKPLLLARVETP